MLDVDADGTAPRHTHRQGGYAHTGKKMQLQMRPSAQSPPETKRWQYLPKIMQNLYIYIYIYNSQNSPPLRKIDPRGTKNPPIKGV